MGGGVSRSFIKPPADTRLSVAELQQAAKEQVLSNFWSTERIKALFNLFDADKNGTLELAEFQNALKHMVKPNAEGEVVMPIIAYPPDLKDDKGEVHLPLPWFWGNFSAMD